MGTRYGGIDLAKRSILEGYIPDGLIAPRSRAYACLDQGLTRASIKGLRVPRSRAYARHDQGLTRATIKGLRAPRSRAYACHDQGLTRATIKGLRVPRSRAYACLDQGLTRATIKGLRVPRSKAYACLDQRWELPARMLEVAAGCRVLPLNPGDLRIILQPRTAAINRLHGLYPRMGILMET
jgi:hypothetical protein